VRAVERLGRAAERHEDLADTSPLLGTARHPTSFCARCRGRRYPLE
jgi:hypothetical protein